MAAYFEWTGIPEFAAALERIVAAASVQTRAAVAEAASEVEKQAKLNASGRPGPNVVTGTLRRGITHDPITPWGVRGWQTQVGPTAIYGRRVELGFAGPDSLGRRFDASRKYPYFVPAWSTVAPRMTAIYAKHWSAALGF